MQFEPPDDIELDMGNLIHVAGGYRQHVKRGLSVLALVERFNNDQSRDLGGLSEPTISFSVWE